MGSPSIALMQEIALLASLGMEEPMELKEWKPQHNGSKDDHPKATCGQASLQRC